MNGSGGVFLPAYRYICCWSKMPCHERSTKDLIHVSAAVSSVSRWEFDLSPVSIRNLMNSHHLPGSMALLHTYHIRRFSTLCRLYGAGFKVLSRLNHTLSDRFKRVKAVWYKPILPFDLNCGLVG